MKAGRPGAVRILFAAAAGFLSLLLLEGASTLLFLVVDRRPFSYSRLAAERAAILDDQPQPDAQEQTDQPAGGAPMPQAVLKNVVHPYLGFVVDRDAPATRTFAKKWDLRVTPEGFYAPRKAPPVVPDDAVVVGIFGGSVAFGFSQYGGYLIRELRRLPPLTGEKLVVRSYAIPGFKQPQQLMTLAYLMTLGERVDVVVNLDGFNEVALPPLDNIPLGVNPFYPRSWSFRVQGFSDPTSLLKVGEIAVLKRTRQERAGLVSAAPLKYSVTANLLWRLTDRRQERRIADLELELARRRSEQRGFLTHGPEWATAKGNEDEVYRQLALHWSRSSRAMASLCAGSGIQYFHFLQPNQYLPGSKPMGAEERRLAVDPKSPYLTSVPAGYPYLRASGEELVREGVAFRDLSMLFSDDGEVLYSDTCCHLNARGNELLAKEVARFIAQRWQPRGIR